MMTTDEQILYDINLRMIKSKIENNDDGLPLDDGRDFNIEAYEEILDAMVYVSAKLIQLRKIQNNRNLK